MTIVVLAIGAAAAAAATAYAAHQHAQPRTALVIDPYTAWMMRNLPTARARHR